jgi:urea transport system permease protein
VKRILSLLIFCFVLIAPSRGAEAAAPDYRVVLADAVLEEDASKQIEMVQQLVDSGDDLVERGLAAWRLSELYLYEAGGTKVALVLDAQLDSDGKAKGIRIRDGKFITDASGKELHFAASDLTPADNTSKLRRAIKTTLDLFALAHPLPKMRRDTATKLGQQRNPEFIPNFEARLKVEKNAEAIKALHEAIALTLTASDDPAVRNAAIKKLGEMRSVNGVSLLRDMEQECKTTPDKYGPETPKVLRAAVQSIDNYLWWGNLVGTLFRGLSLSAVLLVAALGLAITFGLMNVINMAHGEIMAVGAYTAFAVQGIFGGGFLFSLFGKTVSVGGMGLKGGAFDLYFIVALGASFVTGALLGLILERTVIRFLYKRPLESLLATWGVSLILQQLFRHTFGAANVDVSAPSFLSGSVVVNDVGFAYNRIFIIGFAVAIVYGTYLLLTKTSLGLQIRAVMQNRAMASCIGVRTDRVNMMTFALGSGLAGMAGACLSQIANVGPSLGQSYVIDCFMVVVLGGVGNIVGTVTASGGVGVANQILEPWMGAVLGKIAVLVAIILFLQWRPNGIFVTRSRSLDG